MDCPAITMSISFTNTTGATQCVNVDTNTACTGTNFIFTAAYLGSFDPNNICTNWIGDSGSSPNPDQPFQVNVTNGQTLVVVVSEVTPDAGLLELYRDAGQYMRWPGTARRLRLRLRLAAHHQASRCLSSNSDVGTQPVDDARTDQIAAEPGVTTGTTSTPNLTLPRWRSYNHTTSSSPSPTAHMPIP